MKNRENFVILALGVAVTVILAGSANWWFPSLLKFSGFINTNSDLIQGLEALLQILILAGGFLLLVSRIWSSNDSTSNSRPNRSQTPKATGGIEQDLRNVQAGKYSSYSKNTGAVGENNTVYMNINNTLSEDE
jgi:hypothetical protein